MRLSPEPAESETSTLIESPSSPASVVRVHPDDVSGFEGLKTSLLVHLLLLLFFLLLLLLFILLLLLLILLLITLGSEYKRLRTNTSGHEMRDRKHTSNP